MADLIDFEDTIVLLEILQDWLVCIMNFESSEIRYLISKLSILIDRHQKSVLYSIFAKFLS